MDRVFWCQYSGGFKRRDRLLIEISVFYLVVAVCADHDRLGCHHFDYRNRLNNVRYGLQIICLLFLRTCIQSGISPWRGDVLLSSERATSTCFGLFVVALNHVH